jgi:hypothetical protein
MGAAGMINIRQVDTTQPVAADATDNPAETTNEPQAGKKNVPMVWIPATLCVGLLIAAVYLGGRIVTSHPHTRAALKKVAPAPVKPPKTEPQKAEIAKAEIPKAAPVNTTPAIVEAKVEPPAPRKVEVKVKTSEPAVVKQVSEQIAGNVPMISPKEGERYIQIGALDEERTRRYLVHLHEANLAPHVAPGPTPELLRILIGPFSDQNSLITAKNGLDTAGIENFVREY